MKLVRNILFAVLGTWATLIVLLGPWFLPIAKASNVGPGIGAAGIITSPTSASGNISSSGVICTLIKPEAGLWTVYVQNNTSGAGTIVIQILAGDGVTWQTITAWATTSGTITIGTAGVVTFSAATLQGLGYQFSGPILGMRVNALTLTAANLLATISAN